MARMFINQELDAAAPTPAAGHLLHPQYRRDIDGLRAIAVLSVVGFHAFPGLMRGGFVGVDIFFVISGFLISTILFSNLEKKRFSFTEFYARRIRRIFPAALVVLAACYGFGWLALFPDEFALLGKHIAGGAGYVQNLVLLSESGYFDTSAETKPLLHLWSLGIEEQFYIIWPLLLWLAWKARINLLAVAAAIAAISFVLNIQAMRTDASMAFYAPQTRFWELLAGSILAWLTLRRPAASHTTAHHPAVDGRRRRANLRSIAGFVLLGLSFALITEKSFPGWWAALPVLGAALTISAGSAAWLNRVVLGHPIMVWFGLISYPLYLWHWPLLSFARIVESARPDYSIRLPLAAAAILLAWLTFRLVERPLRHHPGKAVAAGLLAAMMLAGLGGYVTFRSQGLPGRTAIAGLHNNVAQLARTPRTDAACLAMIGPGGADFPYCRFTQAGDRTVAVIGDSHAHAAFPGIADVLAGRGVNTLLLANSGCFIDDDFARANIQSGTCSEKIARIVGIAASRADVGKVFIVTHSAAYFHDRNGDPGQIFARSMQRVIDLLRQSGKQVFFLTEPPNINMDPVLCIARPFRKAADNCNFPMARTAQAQAEYLRSANNLQHVTVIHSLPAFCPGGICPGVQDGQLLYADDNHLSVAGSHWLVRQVLQPYLDQ